MLDRLMEILGMTHSGKKTDVLGKKPASNNLKIDALGEKSASNSAVKPAVIDNSHALAMEIRNVLGDTKFPDPDRHLIC